MRDAEQQKYSEIAALVSVTVGRVQFGNAEPRFYTAWVKTGKARHEHMFPVCPQQQMRWMAPAHGIWVPKCEGHKAFTSKMGAIRYADYHDRPRLGQERFSGSRH